MQSTAAKKSNILRAKGPSQWVRGVAPKYLERARGSHVWDVDGNEYIDLTMAVGPVSLGYAYPVVDDAIRAQLEGGIADSGTDRSVVSLEGTATQRGR